MAIHPVILVGGSGTRLWPISRKSYPKQFIPLMSERSLLQETITRTDGIEGLGEPVFVANEDHRFVVAEHIRQIGREPLAIILEPEGRNTAPALTLAALYLAQGAESSGEDPIMLVMPSDHVIRDVDKFKRVVQSCIPLAEMGSLVAVGVVPTLPKTGFGYIKQGEPMPSAPYGENGEGIKAYRIDEFVEKPDLATAQGMLSSKNYLWNSGVFIVQASVWLEQIRRYRPDIAEPCILAHEAGQKDGDFYRPDPIMFASNPKDFVAYSILEMASAEYEKNGSGSGSPDCIVLPLDAGWSDVGDWFSLWEEEDKSADGNVVKGSVDARNMRNSLLISQSGPVIVEGLQDVIIVETADAVLISHQNSVQDVRSIVDQLEAEGRKEHEEYHTVIRPWGSYETLESGANSQVRLLRINPGASLSLHTHEHRSEHWVVLKGIAKIGKGNEEFLLQENQSTEIPANTQHRLENPGSIALEVIELRTGDILSEDDIVRFGDGHIHP